MTVTNEQRKGWEDDVMRGAEYTKKFINFIMSERSQLYGMIIFLMQSNNLTEVILPPIEEFKQIGQNYYAIFETDNEGNFRLSVREQDKVE